MLKILLVKTSSMGDLIHTMPAISDLARSRPDIELHWLVEEGFAEIPLWHPFVKKVHLCAIRRWRKSIVSKNTRSEMKALRASLIAEKFDAVIDAQGLLKSALLVRWLACEKHGYNKKSIREPLASFFYSRKHTVSRKLDAITRNRQLFALACGYIVPSGEADFGLSVKKPLDQAEINAPYAVFLHGTNWNSKVWPVKYWRDLVSHLHMRGLDVLVAWGSAEEKLRAQAIAENLPASVLERHSLTGMAYLLQQASLVVGSDTGLSHLAGALGSKTLGLYGASSSQLTGLRGEQVHSLQASLACSPCLKKECPLVKSGETIPCYDTIDARAVITVLEQDDVK